MKYVKGNLITMADEGQFDVIMHGCNCQARMAAGIAKTIVDRWPHMEEADKYFHNFMVNAAFNPDYRGEIGSRYADTKLGNQIIVINAYTQLYPGKGSLSYDAIHRIFNQLQRDPLFNNSRIGIPMIGAGLAGGNWKIISTIIEETTPELDITVVEYDGS